MAELESRLIFRRCTKGSIFSLVFNLMTLQVWASWIYRAGIRADDRTDQINYPDPKCEPGKGKQSNIFALDFPLRGNR